MMIIRENAESPSVDKMLRNGVSAKSGDRHWGNHESRATVHAKRASVFIMKPTPMAMVVSFRLSNLCAKAVAMEMLLTGDAIGAQRAMEIGMINNVVPYDELMTTALAMADRIIANAPISVKGVKELAYKSFNMDMEDAFELSLKIKNRVNQSDDSKEGPKAFAEKRPAVWKNR